MLGRPLPRGCQTKTGLQNVLKDHLKAAASGWLAGRQQLWSDHGGRACSSQGQQQWQQQHHYCECQAGSQETWTPNLSVSNLKKDVVEALASLLIDLWKTMNFFVKSGKHDLLSWGLSSSARTKMNWVYESTSVFWWDENGRRPVTEVCRQRNTNPIDHPKWFRAQNNCLIYMYHECAIND